MKSKPISIVIFSAAALLFGFLFATDWFSKPVPWQRATGWDSIPEDLRPASRISSPDIRWLGHAGILVTWHNTKVLFDPNLSSRCAVVKRHMQAPVKASDLPAIDAVAISHAHFDHLDNPTLEGIAQIGTVITPKGTDDYLSQQVKERTVVHGLKLGESQQIGPLEITAVPAVHKGGRYHPFPSRYFAVGYILRDDTSAIYFAGDTAYGEHFKKIAELYHPRLALLPIGGYLPRFPLKYHHLSPEEAVEAASVLKVKSVIPIHFGTFRIAFDRPASALPLFARAARAAGVSWEMPQLISRKDVTDPL